VVVLTTGGGEGAAGGGIGAGIAENGNGGNSALTGEAAYEECLSCAASQVLYRTPGVYNLNRRHRYNSVDEYHLDRRRCGEHRLFVVGLYI